MDELMDVKEAAQYLKISYMTIYKLAQRKKIPAFKIGGNWRFKKEILDEWLKQQTIAQKESILIVDDDSTVRDVLRDIIEKQGYSVITAGSGKRALEEIGKRHFDLIFLDLKLPDLSGTEILSAVKEKAKDVIIVVVTGYADEPIAIEAMSLGPLLLVRKPFREKDIQEVFNIVRKGKRT